MLCSIDVFFALLSKVGFSVGGRALSFALCTLGCSGFLASAIAFFVKILISNDSIGKMVLPAGTEAGESESSGSWRKYLHCLSRKEIPPPNHPPHPRGVAPGLGGGLIRRFRHRPQAIRQQTGGMEQAGPSQIAPPGPTPTVSETKERLGDFLSSFGRRRASSSFIERTANDLDLKNASPHEKNKDYRRPSSAANRAFHGRSKCELLAGKKVHLVSE